MHRQMVLARLMHLSMLSTLYMIQLWALPWTPMIDPYLQVCHTQQYGNGLICHMCAPKYVSLVGDLMQVGHGAGHRV